MCLLSTSCPTVACPWVRGQQFLMVDEALRSSQSVVVNQSCRVVKTVFMKGLGGHITTHKVSLDTVICEILGGLENGMDVVVSFNGKLVGMHDTMRDIGIEHCGTLRCTGRLRGGAQRFRQQQLDTPGQWTCSACGQERVWLVRNRCFQCGCPRGHDPAPPAPSPYNVGPTGRPPQRVNPVNPTNRPNQRQSQPSPPPASVQNFHRWPSLCQLVRLFLGPRFPRGKSCLV